jgi:hypothetical protein
MSTPENEMHLHNSHENFDGRKTIEEMKVLYKHIDGWGIDADPDNEPTYPMKKYTGDDHDRLNYKRPLQQTIDIEVLHSNERPNVSAVFGTVSPPSGLSGAVRRLAFRYSEDSLKHWFALVLADRINVIEGLIDDFRNGGMPDIIGETGLRTEWKYNKKEVIKKLTIAVAVTSFLIVYLQRKRRAKSRLSW